jgi:hypothetical protein
LFQLASLPHLNGFPIHDTVNICFTHKGVNIVMLLQNERNGDAKKNKKYKTLHHPLLLAQG